MEFYLSEVIMQLGKRFEQLFGSFVPQTEQLLNTLNNNLNLILPQTVEFSTPGAYTVTIPTNIKFIRATLVGGGGKGGTTANINDSVSGGGGGGAIIEYIVPVSDNMNLDVVVGEGGSDSNTGDGNYSLITAQGGVLPFYLQAFGGKKGTTQTSPTTAIGGNGGNVQITAINNTAGGTGGNNANGNPGLVSGNIYSGGGGGSGKDTVNGYNGGPVTINAGGNGDTVNVGGGGASAFSPGNNANTNNAPNIGAGGGGTNNGSNNSGGNGYVKIDYLKNVY